MKKLYVCIFKIMLRIFPSYIYSKNLNILKNKFAKKALISVEGNVNFGKNIRMSMDISIGSRSGIGDNALLNGPISIGDDVMMGPNVVVYRRNHASNNTDIPMIQQGMTQAKKLTIGNDVWIGDDVMILPGCSYIGDGSIIGARAVVTKNVPQFSVFAGNPGKVVKFRKKID